ncbi:hypothetical protein P3T33_005193 [Rhizobium sp. AN67]|nr:hypothetical protein [Rhizobium sp. AN67]
MESDGKISILTSDVGARLQINHISSDIDLQVLASYQ